jgi:predicted MFS family arabinose efflux permease
MKLFEILPTKFVLIAAIILQCCALLMFTLIDKYELQAFSRFLSGFAQVIFAIFLPVWVDAFAPRDRKTKWMTYIISAAPLGLLSGYLMSAFVLMAGLSW